MSEPGGAILVCEESHDLPLCHLQVALRAGAALDPPEAEGLTNFTTELMARGAAGKTRAEIDAAFDALGASLGIVTDHDGVHFGLTVLAAKLVPALQLLANVLLRPDFPPAEADKLSRELAARLDELREDDSELARRYFQRALFGAHPYGRSALGRIDTIEAFSVEAARAWHARFLIGGNAILALAGDIAASEAPGLWARGLAGLKPGPSPVGAPYPDPPLRRGLHLTLVDKPERTQSQILLGHPAPRWSDPDFYPLHVVLTAFGGTFTSWLMEEVRVKRGLSYGASARLWRGRGKRAVVMHVFPSLEQTPETLELVLGLYQRLAEEGLPEKDVEFAKGYLAKNFAFQIATPEDRLDLGVAVELAELPADYGARFAERVLAVTAADVERVLRAHLRPRDLEICIVSTAEALEPRLRQAGLLEGTTFDVVSYDSY